MGMANARDRTVATNYAREEMEDIKNMDFDLITNENLGVAEIIEGKFNRVVTVIDEHNNLKKITTRVFWNDRSGKTINVETNMLISRTQLNPGEAANIILYADPYYTVLPDSGTANIIAVIKDIKGNTKIDWDGGDIHFSILGDGYSDYPKNSIGSYLGYLGPGADEIYVTQNEGRAEITFTATPIGGELLEGDVIIEASAQLPDGSIISNTIKITVTLNVVRVELIATPLSIKADGISTSTIEARLLDSGSNIVTGAQNDITFNISGDGIFVDYLDGSPLPNTVTLTPSNGIVNIKAKSIVDTPGVTIVTASSEGLLSDTVNIITTVDPHSISVSVNPIFIYTDDIIGATVTVTIKDVNGNPVEYEGYINLSTSYGTGTFGQDTISFNGISSASTTFSSTTPGIITITASGGVLISGSTTIEVRSALIADNVTLTAVPQNILAGGEDTSEITATVKQGTTTISNYNNDITFEIVSDTSSSEDALLSFNSNTYATNVPLTITGDNYGNDGVAVVHLKPASNVGTATIKVFTYNSLNEYIEEVVEVRFYSSAHHIELSAVPQKMLVNGDICTINAIIVDEYGTKVQNYNELITFTFLEGYPSSAKFFSADTMNLTKTVEDGVVDVVLVSQSIAGTVTLEATSFTGITDITGYLNIPVGINLELADPPNIAYYNETYEVSFDINVQGAVLILEEMQVSWLPNDSETLNKIEINPNSTGNPVIYTSTLISSGGLIDVIDSTLSTGVSNVKLYFNESMSGKTLEVIFNPNSGNYPVEIIVPMI